MSASDQTLAAVIQERVGAFVASGKPEEIIDAATERMFSEVIKELFSTYGDMGKEVKDAVKAALPGNMTQAFELRRYESLIINAVAAHWEGSSLTADLVRRAQASVEEAVAGLQMSDTVSLRELLEAFVEEHAERAMEDDWEAPDIRIEQSDAGARSSFYHIYFDCEPLDENAHIGRARSVHLLSNNLACVQRSSEPESEEATLPSCEVYAGKVDGDVLGRKFGPARTKYEQLMLALYYRGARLVIDCEADEFSYPSRYD